MEINLFDNADSIPNGYIGVPLTTDSGPLPLTVSVLLKTEPDEASAPLVVLRDDISVKAYLGCIQDRAGRVLAWVELWVEQVSAWSGSPESVRETLTNAVLDQRFARALEDCGRLSPDGVIATGWEGGGGSPLFIDLNARAACALRPDLESPAWVLCDDDTLLTRHGLPPYHQSLHRYAYSPEQDAEAARFVPLTKGAPTNDATLDVEDVLPGARSLLPLNVESGGMIVRPYYPLALHEYVRVLEGAPWEGIFHGRTTLDPTGAAPGLGPDGAAGRFLLGGRGIGGKLLETFALKVNLLLQIYRAVAAQVAAEKAPLLNIDEDSFRISLGTMSEFMPFLWTATSSLVRPGDAVALSIPQTDERHFVSASSGKLSVYRPQSAGNGASGRGTVRIREVLDDSRAGRVATGTLQTNEQFDVCDGSLIWLRVNLASGGLDLYAKLEQDAAATAGEWRFRTVGIKQDAAALADLEAAAGVPLQNVPFEFFPLNSTPCDLYALAVLSVRVLLLGQGSKMAVVLDELTSLGRAAGCAASGDDDLPQAIAAAFEKDVRWRNSLGPQHLTQDAISSEEAFALVPTDYWYGLLAMLVMMLPELTEHSICRHYGDAPSVALERVFDPCIHKAHSILIGLRNCMIPDAGSSNEIREIIDLLK